MPIVAVEEISEMIDKIDDVEGGGQATITIASDPQSDPHSFHAAVAYL